MIQLVSLGITDYERGASGIFRAYFQRARLITTGDGRIIKLLGQFAIQACHLVKPQFAIHSRLLESCQVGLQLRFTLIQISPRTKNHSADQDWIPSGEGYSLYLRPTVIATHPQLGLSPPNSLLLYVITSPVGPYYASGFDPVKLTADTYYVVSGCEVNVDSRAL